jgi:hypothetical protein
VRNSRLVTLKVLRRGNQGPGLVRRLLHLMLAPSLSDVAMGACKLSKIRGAPNRVEDRGERCGIRRARCSVKAGYMMQAPDAS